MFDWRWSAFFTRVTAGLLFGMAGVHKVFIVTRQVHARKLFLEPYQHTWIPHFLLWLLGVGIPFLELIGRLATRCRVSSSSLAISLGLFASLSHLRPCVTDPLFNVNSHIFPRLMLLLPTLALRPEVDPWSLDATLAWRQARKTR